MIITLLNKKYFLQWIPLGITVILLSGLIYLTLQQYIRQSANDPQIQIAQDTAYKLSLGQPQYLYIPSNKVDIANSLATFIITYDSKGKVTGSSAILDTQTPSLPKGVLDFTKQNLEDKFTWQPGRGVRIAAVVEYFSGTNSGYVLVGRSLKEVEIRKSFLLQEIFLGCIVTLLISYASFALCSSFKKN